MCGQQKPFNKSYKIHVTEISRFMNNTLKHIYSFPALQIHWWTVPMSVCQALATDFSISSLHNHLGNLLLLSVFHWLNYVILLLQNYQNRFLYQMKCHEIFHVEFIIRGCANNLNSTPWAYWLKFGLPVHTYIPTTGLCNYNPVMIPVVKNRFRRHILNILGWNYANANFVPNLFLGVTRR